MPHQTGEIGSTSSQKLSTDWICEILADGKAEKILIIPLEGKSSLADSIIIASGQSGRQVRAIAERLIRDLKNGGFSSPSVEGMGAGDWILVDMGSIIVHLFRPEVRAFYQIEDMWNIEPEGRGVTEGQASGHQFDEDQTLAKADSKDATLVQPR